MKKKRTSILEFYVISLINTNEFLGKKIREKNVLELVQVNLRAYNENSKSK